MLVMKHNIYSDYSLIPKIFFLYQIKEYFVKVNIKLI